MSQLLPILAQYLQEDPDDPFNHYAYAVELAKSAPEEAFEIMQSIVNQFPDYLPVYYTAASLASDLEEYQAGKKLLLEGISLAEATNEQKALSELKRALLNLEAEL